MSAFYYRRWDNSVVYCRDVEMDNVGNVMKIGSACVIADREMDKSMIMLDYSKLKYEEKERVYRFRGVQNVTIPAHLFISKIEKCMVKGVTIRSLDEYINCIDIYRYQSLLIHILSLLRDRNGDELSELKKIIVKNIEDYRCKTKSEWHDPLFEEISTKMENCEDEVLITEIRHAIKTYQNGGAYCYYRGVGKCYYPEQPGIFRDKRIFEEDRWYRSVKIHHQDELDRLPYLDRLTMLQHYGLPTRLLDVTSNPLVALYMAVNKLYTGDRNQSETGEIIVYFDDYGLEDYFRENGETSATNYGDDSIYVYDGKAYDSSVVLMIASLVKLKVENKQRMYRVLMTFKKMIDKVAAGDPDVRIALSKLVNFCIHVGANQIIDGYCFSETERKQIHQLRKVIQKLKGKGKLKKPEDVCSLLWETSSGDSDNLGVTKDEFIQEFEKFLSSYRYLLSTVRRENPAFVDHVNVFDLLKSFHVRTGLNNERIRAQMGSSIICGLDKNYINEKMPSSRRDYSIRLFVENKKQIASALNVVGINDLTMLPDIGNLAGFLKEQVSDI